MAVRIRPLTRLTNEDIAWTTAGYVSSQRYRVTKTETRESVTITLALEPLAHPYTKRWDALPAEILELYRRLPEGGYCLAAYDGDFLAGLLLAERRDWNRTLFIWEFHVRREYRRRGIGRRLMSEAAVLARLGGLRVMAAETQSTNVAAIDTYRALGFEVGAVDLSYYTNDDADPGQPGAEVAVCMKRKL